MRFSNELRVGIMFLTGLILLVLVIVTLTRWGEGRNTYEINVRFPRAEGLLEGAPVRVAGVQVGHVGAIDLDTDTYYAVASLRIDQRVVLHKNYNFIIGLGGLVGERYVEITPVRENPGPIVLRGETVDGDALPSVGEAIANANVLIDKLGTVTDSINIIIGDKANQDNIREAIANLRVASDEAVKLTQSMNRITTSHEEDITVIIANLRNITTSVNDVANVLVPQLIDSPTLSNLELASERIVHITESVDSMTRSIDEMISDPQLASDMRQAVFHLKQASIELDDVLTEASEAASSFPIIMENLEIVSEDLPEITGPLRQVTPEVAENVRQISINLRNTSYEVGTLVSQVSRTTARLRTLYVEPEGRLVALLGGDNNTRADLNVNVFGDDTMFRGGITSIGNHTKVNVQFGNRLDERTWFRYGLVQSRFGVGVDYYGSPDWRLTGELFDPDSIRANLIYDHRFQPLGHDWWFTTGFFDLFNDNTWGLGLTYRPEVD